MSTGKTVVCPLGQLLKFTTFEQEQLNTPGLLWCDPDTVTGTGGQLGRACGLWR